VTFPKAAVQAGAGSAGDARPIIFPLDWVLRHGAAAVQYRALVDVAHLDQPSPRLRALVYTHPPVIELAVTQPRSGVWHDSMLALPSGGEGLAGIGTVPAVHRLLELGVEPDFPSLLAARRPLFRLLAEDNDPAYVYELRAHARDPARRRYARLQLREAAAATLARMGHEQDPRLRGCANRMVQRVRAFLESRLAAHPWIVAGGKRVLSPDASPPTRSLLVMLAHLPRFRQENHGFMQQLRRYLTQPAPPGEVWQAIGGAVVERPQLVLGDPVGGGEGTRGSLVTTLFWLELLARLGKLDLAASWASVFERLLEMRDRDGIWRAGRGKAPAPVAQPELWPWYPLDPRKDGDAISAEITLRLGIIARAAGREIQVA
jgi:hypothetical protein